MEAIFTHKINETTTVGNNTSLKHKDSTVSYKETKSFNLDVSAKF